jgi:hypothetical protein
MTSTSHNTNRPTRSLSMSIARETANSSFIIAGPDQNGGKKPAGGATDRRIVAEWPVGRKTCL